MKKILSIALLYIQVSYAQNNYGEFSYGHTDASRTSCGKSLTNYPGFLLAGYNNSSSNLNFTIDRTDKGGLFTGSTYEFSNEYRIYADISGVCNISGTSPITTFHGVSVIESQIPAIQSEYAVAASFDEGCLISFLYLNGQPINTNTFFFPFPSTAGITKPIILEDPGNPSLYFVAGSYNNTMYVLETDRTGAISWSYTYAISGVVNDMILSASNDPVIVGYTTLNGDKDGFITEISGSTGIMNFFRRYDLSNYDQEFSCIANASNPSTGYIVGGVCETSPGQSHPYNINLTTSGFRNWDNVIVLNADVNARNIVGIIERPANTYPTEYYGVTTTSLGIVAIRMDNNGAPTWTGFGTRRDEFIFNSPGNNMSACNVTFYDNLLSTTDLGLQVYGTDGNSSAAMPYFAKAYFSGQSGCNIPSNHLSSWSPTCNRVNVTITTNTGLTACNASYLNYNPYNNFIANCGPYSSVANSSNAKTTAIAELSDETKNDAIMLFPNPASNSLSISYPERDGEIKITIFNSIGQEIKSVMRSGNSGNESFNLLELNIPDGLYIVRLISEAGTANEQFLKISN